MIFNLDAIIFIGFLIANIALGLFSSKGIKNIKEYAVGNRNFSTATITATIVATWVGGSYFFNTAAQTYRNGLNIVWVAAASDLLHFLLISIVFAPRMKEFLGKLSIAEAMGDLFGPKVRLVTAISGFIGTCGIIALQLRVAGLLFEYALNLPSIYGIFIAGIIVTLYSSLGGIKSVTFTDVIQFLTFGAVIPAIAYFLLNNLENVDFAVEILANNPKFDYREIFDFTQAAPWYYLFLFLCFAFPDFNPAIFQRISMAKNTIQVSKSFKIAAFTCASLSIIISAIGILAFINNQDINTDEVVKYIIFNSEFGMGFKGLILAGIMAMIMSTIDSYINSTSVLIVHDFLKPLKVKLIVNELFSARIVSLLIGTVAILLSLRDSNLLSLAIFALSFYMPIVSIPFIMAIFGFRSTGKSVIAGMTAGLFVVLAWDYFDITFVDSIIPAMFVNWIFLMGTHYFFKQEGGWVGSNGNKPVTKPDMPKAINSEQFSYNVKNFKLIEACKRNYPEGEGLMSIFGLLVMIVTFSSVSTMPKHIHAHYAYLLDVLYPMTLCTSSPIMGYPLWLESWKKSNFIGVVWNFTAFFVLICFSCLMVFISNFSGMQVTVFLINVVVISSLVRWQWALGMITIGVGLVTFCFNFYLATDIDYGTVLMSEFKVVYLLLLICSTLVLFLRPKQQYQERIEQTNQHLNSRMDIQNQDLQKAWAIKSEFLRNITHEYHAALTGVMNTAETLRNAYDKLTDKHRKVAIDTIYKSTISLKSLDDNVVTLARLCEPNYKFEKLETNFSNFVYERVALCRKYYEDNQEDREFTFNIEENIIANIDKSYMAFVVDNLVINAIKFCPKGKITITVSKDEIGTYFIIEDEGIGFSAEEKDAIFDAFQVGSKTKTPAGGRGAGLAVCKGIVEKHDGVIETQSDGIRGAIFKVILLS